MKIKYLLFVVFAGLILFTACEKENEVQITDNHFIKKIVSSDGKVVTNFVYSVENKLLETQSYFTCSKYTYENGRLMKVETAVDEQLTSSASAIYNDKSKLMTSANSKFTSYSDYIYLPDGKLDVVKNYAEVNGKIEYRSMRKIEYTKEKLTKIYLYNDKDEVTQFTVFEYDALANISLEKDYSYLNTDHKAELLREMSYRYDNNYNPFMIYKDLAIPGLYSNLNNMIEIKTTNYMDYPGVEKNSVQTTSYEYNSKGFPVKENGNYLYIY